MDNASEPRWFTRSYAEMAADQPRERDAGEWWKELIGDAWADRYCEP